MLQGKYLKYTEDITLEIFIKIIERLNKTGWKHLVDNSIDFQFNEFTHDKYLVYSAGNNYNFYKDNVLKSTDVELKVSDILGSDYDIDKSQFEVGKWYKILNNWYGKFETIHNSGKRIKFSEVITNSGEYKNEGTHIDFISEIELLTDLSEIQQYLPDGHPDKLPKLLTIDDLVEGEAYFAKFDKEEWNSLFYCKTPPRFIARLYISDKYNGKRYDPGDWGFTKGNKYRLATPEEKQWLNACISEGKFVEKEVALKDYNMHGKALKSEVNEIKEEFKVGDWVYADRQSDGDFRYKLGDSYIPIFKVEEIYRFSAASIWLRPIKNRANGIESKYCRLATPEEIAKVTKPVEKPFEFNKWYKYEGKPKYLVFIHENGRYGFNTDGDWFDQKEPDSIEHFNKYKNGFVLAEDSEVKERLLKYAKEKYPAGTKFKSAQTDREYIVKTNSYYVYNSLDAVDVDRVPYLFLEGKWAEIISTPETKEPKEMQLSDLKNPVFNIGDKVRLIANSLKEFNSSWGWGNNSTYRKGYEGLITKIKETKSGFEEINTWYCLDNNSNGISCNLLELVEPVKKEFDRNWYNKPQKQLSDILPEYKQPIKTEEELSHIIDTNEELRNEIGNLINQRDFKFDSIAELKQESKVKLINVPKI